MLSVLPIHKNNKNNCHSNKPCLPQSFLVVGFCTTSITSAGEASCLNKLYGKACSHRSLDTLETEVESRLQTGISQTKPSTIYSMSWQSDKVHLVPSSPAHLFDVYQGLLQVIICASHHAQCSLQQYLQPPLVSRILKPGCLRCLYMGHLICSFFLHPLTK